MKQELTSLIKKYEPLGQWEAGELLLRPADALRFADDLLAIGVPLWGVDIWYYVEGGIAEDPVVSISAGQSGLNGQSSGFSAQPSDLLRTGRHRT
jgi:hypothetical protein